MASQPFSPNLLLSALSPEALDFIVPHCTRVDLPLKELLHQQGHPATHVVFLETAMASGVVHSGKEQTEVGIAGREAVSSTSPILGGAVSSFESFIQIPGRGLRISVGHLDGAMAANAELRRLLLRFAESQMAQVAHTALANARFTILERAARWLLMCHDRIP